MIDISIEKLNETVFLDGTQYFNALLVDILHAQQSIDLETYIFQNDPLGLQVTEALVAAAKRGVKIKILVDGAGTPTWGHHLTKQLEKAGVQTRVFHPLPWRLWQWRRSFVRVPFIFKILYFIFKINTRNHRKVCIIDKKIAYIGSINISKCHLKREQGGDNWRDTAVRLSSANISDLQAAFDGAWDHQPIQERIQHMFTHVRPFPTFRLNNTRHRRRSLYKNLLRKVGKCQKRIWITNAYFVPDNFLLKQLNERARAGLDVRILLPQKSDVFIMPWASTAFYESLLKSGVRIFEYTPSMLHAKTLILDDWTLVGSSNLNHRSLLHDLEVDVTIKHSESKKAIENQFLCDLACSKEISLENWHKRTLLKKLIGRLLLYVKFWI